MGTPTAILQVICPDRPGLVSELSGWVAMNGGNIRHADHHTDVNAGVFLSRIEWGLAGFGLPRDAIGPAVEALARRLDGVGQLHVSDAMPRVAIFVSRQDHVLLDLLWRTRAGELPMTVPLVVSNHPDLRPIAEGGGARFALVPVTADTRAEAEAAQLALLADHESRCAGCCLNVTRLKRFLPPLPPFSPLACAMSTRFFVFYCGRPKRTLARFNARGSAMLPSAHFIVAAHALRP